MAQPKSSAQRMRKLRDRRRCGTVIVQGIEVKQIGVELLIAKGWLAANVEPNAVQVRTALVKLVNKTLTAPEPAPQPEPKPEPEPSPKPFRRRAIEAVKSLSVGLVSSYSLLRL